MQIEISTLKQKIELLEAENMELKKSLDQDQNPISGKTEKTI